MTNPKTYLAVDLGATSGRVVAGRYDGEVLELEAVHRFSTLPVEVDGTLRLDLEAFFLEILNGIGKAVTDYGPIVSAGVSSWGGQPVALDANGNLLEMAYYYRDPHYSGLAGEVHSRMSAHDLYRITGTHESSLPRILAHAVGRSPDMSKVDRFLMIADYFAYRLSGVKANEYSNTRMSQLLDARTGTWSEEILDRMNIPRRLFGKILHAPEILGDVKEELLPNGSGQIRAVAVGTHDTSSAVAAAPIKDGNAAFISLGTWAITGCEVAEPVITDTTFSHSIQNNAIMSGPVALVRNRVGVWLLEECRRSWRENGKDYSYSELAEMARAANPFTAVLKTDSREFFAPGDMPSRVLEILRNTGQGEPKDDGQLIRIILEGQALSYRDTLDLISGILGRTLSCVHVIGGGSRNEILNQFIADACGVPVIAGPDEATSAGNIMAQMMADGEVKSLKEGRELIARSWPTKGYEPGDQSPWNDALERLRRLGDNG